MNSIEKALTLLLAFEKEQPSWGVRELSAHLGFSPATVLRMLQTLKRYDFIRQDQATKKYRLGNVYFNFFRVLRDTDTLGQAVAPYLESLREKTGETVHFNVIEDRFRVCALTLESRQSLKAGMPVGNRSPLHAGASSKCLLAFAPETVRTAYLSKNTLAPVTENTIVNCNQLQSEIEDIRALGYASSLAERTPGLGSLSAPLLNDRGKLLGSISLAIPEIRYKDYDHRNACIAALLDTVKAARATLGHYEPGQ